MIVVFITEEGVKEVRFQAKEGPLSDTSVVLWPTVKEELRRLDRRVKQASRRVVSRLLGEP